jgi:hypothetical protein
MFRLRVLWTTTLGVGSGMAPSTITTYDDLASNLINYYAFIDAESRRIIPG